MAQLNGLGRDEMHVIAMVLARRQGSRLLPLTLDRAKPAVPSAASNV